MSKSRRCCVLRRRVRKNTSTAFGTSSRAFVDASLFQLIAAARLPGSGISEIGVNAALAFIEGAKPADEVECALIIQMACTHTASMAVLGTLGGAHDAVRNVAAKASAAARLSRTFAVQMETLRRWRNGGSQTVRVACSRDGGCPGNYWSRRSRSRCCMKDGEKNVSRTRSSEKLRPAPAVRGGNPEQDRDTERPVYREREGSTGPPATNVGA